MVGYMVYIPKIKFHHNEYKNVPQNSHNNKTQPNATSTTSTSKATRIATANSMRTITKLLDSTNLKSQQVQHSTTTITTIHVYISF